MKTSNWKTVMLAGVMCGAAAIVSAQDNSKGEPQGMPPMGPPEEMKQCASLVGTWDCVMKMHMSMDPNDTSWMESKAVATYKYILGGSSIEMTFEATMMGQPFVGGGWMFYDRESKMWQQSWADNMSARLSLYTGTKGANSSSFSGEDKMMGQTYLSRISTSNETATSFDWKGEQSMDGGKTWSVWATAVYTKRK